MQPECQPLHEVVQEDGQPIVYRHIVARQVLINTRTWKVSLVWRHSDDGRAVFTVPLTHGNLARKLAWALWNTTIARWHAQATYQLAASGILDREIGEVVRWQVWRSFSLRPETIIARLDKKYGLTKVAMDQANQTVLRQWHKANAEDRKQTLTATR